MSDLLEADERQRPDLFVWHGRLDRSRVAGWLGGLGLRIPKDLFELWARTGGGEMFESETILSPFDPDDDATLDVAGVNATQRNRGLPPGYLVFHVGLGGFSAVRLDDGKYVQLDERNFMETSTYASLDAWYREVLRAEYASRYGLV